MTTWYVALPTTVAVIVVSAFFVVIEFSLLAARRHRLEETAATSASSRAALRSLNELTVMLAGAQLGITAATFALGAVTKPWVHQLIEPVFRGLPDSVSYAVSFLVALFLVTFLHLVVGEMAPKSWALTHPEQALRIIARPACVFITVFRPLLTWINTMANALVRRAGVEPVDRAAARGYDAETLRHLVEHSRESGALDAEAATQITGLISLESLTVDDLATVHHPLPATASVADVRERRTMRVLLDAPTPHVVHVRDTLLADAHSPALRHGRPALLLPPTTTVADALHLMRTHHEQVAVVPGPELRVITWDDILSRLW